MKKRIIASFILFLACSLLSACSFPWTTNNDSTFAIRFIDVGQGDCALVECDGQYMLIDGGDVSHGDKVYSVLVDKNIKHLDILAISHPDTDHIGGFKKVLTFVSTVGIAISNTKEADTKVFNELEPVLLDCCKRFKVPNVGEVYKLGSAEIEIVNVEATDNNDSLVILITYGSNRFLFTGDIEGKAQKKLTDTLSNDSRADDDMFKVDLIKMPHHGAYNDDAGISSSNMVGLIRLLKPDYAIISVGSNQYGHPHAETLDLLKQAEVKVLRTDQNGDIIVKSDGKTLSVVTE